MISSASNTDAEMLRAFIGAAFYRGVPGYRSDFILDCLRRLEEQLEVARSLNTGRLAVRVDRAEARARELEEQLETARERCPICTHEWRRHDPEDGKCDAGGGCRCGRDLGYQRVRNAALSRVALDGAAIARMALASIPAKNPDK